MIKGKAVFGEGMVIARSLPTERQKEVIYGVAKKTGLEPNDVFAVCWELEKMGLADIDAEKKS